jgi:hypothetical protein
MDARSNEDQKAAESLEIVFQINKILDCGLDKETLSICVALIESGVNPEVRIVPLIIRSLASFS